jgi:hypothetical protein
MVIFSLGTPDFPPFGRATKSNQLLDASLAALAVSLDQRILQAKCRPHSKSSINRPPIRRPDHKPSDLALNPEDK